MKKVVGMVLVASAFIFSTFAYAHGERDKKFTRRINPNQVTTTVHSRLLSNVGVTGYVQMKGAVGNINPMFGSSLSTGTPLGRTTGVNDTGHYSEFELGHTDLYIHTHMNNWTKLFVQLNNGGATTNSVNINEAYVTFSKFDRYPYFLRLGKQVLPFGKSDRSSERLYDSTTHQLSVTTVPSAMAGFIDMHGFDGSVFLFNPHTNPASNTETRLSAGGAYLGYMGHFHSHGRTVDYTAQVSYTSSLAEADNLHGLISDRLVDRIGGTYVKLKFKFQPFSLKFDYLTATKSFDQTEFSTSNQNITTGKAKPHAFGVKLGTGLRRFGLPGRACLGFQNSDEAVDVRGSGYVVPKKRYFATYKYDLFKNANLRFDLRSDWDYDLDAGGSGDRATVFSTGLTVGF